MTRHQQKMWDYMRQAAHEEWEFDNQAAQTIAEKTEESLLRRRYLDELSRQAVARRYRLGAKLGPSPEETADSAFQWRQEWNAAS